MGLRALSRSSSCCSQLHTLARAAPSRGDPAAPGCRAVPAHCSKNSAAAASAQGGSRRLLSRLLWGGPWWDQSRGPLDVVDKAIAPSCAWGHHLVTWDILGAPSSLLSFSSPLVYPALLSILHTVSPVLVPAAICSRKPSSHGPSRRRSASQAAGRVPGRRRVKGSFAAEAGLGFKFCKISLYGPSFPMLLASPVPGSWKPSQSTGREGQLQK